MSAVTNVEDGYDEYNYDQDKLVNSGHSGNIIIHYEPNDIIDIADLSTFLLGGTFLTWFFFCHFTGKNRSKKEASEHTNHFDPSGHSRKLSTKLQNTESNKKEENLKPHPSTRK